MKSCVIIGYGRLGQTLASVLKDKYVVSILEIDPLRSLFAEKDGFKIINLGDLRSYDQVYVCVPINRFEDTIKKLKDKLKRGAVIIDTCSIKIMPVRVMKKYLPKDVQILATHPLFGPDSIKSGIPGLRFVYCPVRVNSRVLNSWIKYWSSKEIVMLAMTPQEHDRQSAYSLAITHYIGRVLAELNLRRQDVLTLGFDSLLKVVENTTNDSWQLSHDMLYLNPYVRDMRKDIIDALNKVEKKLQ
jgi:prephenate dehydrogenase